MDNEDKESRADREQDEIVLRVTAQYVEEIQAGHKPEIGDYVARYPQYADAIAAFIAYYQIVELPSAQGAGNIENLEDTDSTGEFAEEFHIAIESAWQRVSSPEIVSESVDGEEIDHISEIGAHGEDKDVVYRQTLQSLFIIAKQRRLSLSQLAAYIDISEDIVTLLEQRAVLLESVPTELYRRLAATLHQPMGTMQSFSGMEHRQRVAEQSGEYHIGDSGNTRDTSRLSQKVSFREMVDNSEKLSAEQKSFWRDVLTKEGM
ncbi:MAG TPA: hypothetical protein VKU38_04555 [Ktedonobacteraceae bacterium]|nr:hypothetical protein [Ktedonobacteraceae bacterium]